MSMQKHLLILCTLIYSAWGEQGTSTGLEDRLPREGQCDDSKSCKNSFVQLGVKVGLKATKKLKETPMFGQTQFDLSELLQVIDFNKDGVLDAFDLQHVSPAFVPSMFGTIDINKDGIVEASEFQHACKQLNGEMIEEQMDVLFKALGMNKEMRLSLEEFQKVFLQAKTLEPPQELAAQVAGEQVPVTGLKAPTSQFDLSEIVQLIDFNKDGVIDASDLQHVSPILAPQMFYTLDVDKDGILEASEFQKINGQMIDDEQVGALFKALGVDRHMRLSLGEFQHALVKVGQ